MTPAPINPTLATEAANTTPQAPLRPGRPTLARSEAINADILNAARDHFLSLGFEATPMESVAVAAGISKGTLYSRYPTKEALLQAVVADRLQAWSAEADARHGPMPTDFKQRLNYIARTILESLASEEIHAFQRVLTSTADAGGELARALHEAGHRSAIAMLSETILQGTTNFPVPPRDPTRVAEMLMSMLTGWYDAHRRVRDIGHEEAMAFAEHAVDVIFHGRAAW
ncbi:TetR/AcrR family transcriptional regulator [Caulobacter sp. BK020]|uniref:TetR/AcrR family transcriptional regulator n=1 Tax=Caulobacter sp. BK020 TaxID=2512117 RepID=UPI0010EAEBA7|nr:TetR/AcrR family transcriptional regulator [Caulobacter sp. BK020]TCS14939.1 TetR family transcriptional regulator [Caulobacter sp. BK020]